MKKTVELNEHTPSSTESSRGGRHTAKPSPKKALAGVGKWTQGPWLIRVAGTSTGCGPEVYAEGPHYDDDGEFVVADCGSSEYNAGAIAGWMRTDDADAVEANAHLIAAAPDLYEALEYFAHGGHFDHCAVVEHGNDCDCGVAKARIALAKARGASHAG